MLRPEKTFYNEKKGKEKYGNAVLNERIIRRDAFFLFKVDKQKKSS